MSTYYVIADFSDNYTCSGIWLGKITKSEKKARELLDSHICVDKLSAICKVENGLSSFNPNRLSEKYFICIKWRN